MGHRSHSKLPGTRIKRLCFDGHRSYNKISKIANSKQNYLSYENTGQCRFENRFAFYLVSLVRTPGHMMAHPTFS